MSKERLEKSEMPDTETIVLTHLLRSRPEFLSGNVLAKRLGISRVGIWNKLEKLREQNFAFEAVRHRGYRLSREPDELNGTLLRAYLALSCSEANILYLPEIDSTNSEAERQLAAGRESPFVILSSKQTRGRGRMGREWYSPEDKNCYMSFVFRPSLPPDRLQKFTLWMGLAMCHLLNEKHDLPTRVKWPNDLTIGNKKVGGMLTEARVDADQTRDLIFGLGINVNSCCEHWPEEIAVSATSLKMAAGEPVPINALAAELISEGMKAYYRFCEEDYEEDFSDLWKRYDALKGARVIANPTTESISGIANGIDLEGALILRTEDDCEISLRAGEVTLDSRVAATG